MLTFNNLTHQCQDSLNYAVLVPSSVSLTAFVSCSGRSDHILFMVFFITSYILFVSKTFFTWHTFFMYQAVWEICGSCRVRIPFWQVMGLFHFLGKHKWQPERGDCHLWKAYQNTHSALQPSLGQVSYEILSFAVNRLLHLGSW